MFAIQSFSLLLCVFSLSRLNLAKRPHQKTHLPPFYLFCYHKKKEKNDESFPFDLVRLFGLPFLYALMCVCFLFRASKMFVWLKSLRCLSKSFMFDFVLFNIPCNHHLNRSDRFSRFKYTNNACYNEPFEWVISSDHYWIGFKIQIHAK